MSLPVLVHGVLPSRMVARQVFPAAAPVIPGDSPFRGPAPHELFPVLTCQFAADHAYVEGETL
jgi:hypothetical protein